MGCGSSVAKQPIQQTKDVDDTATARPLTRSSTLTTVSSTRGRKASSSVAMPYLVDYGKLARSVDEELDELQSSFRNSPPSNALTKATSFKYGDVEMSPRELSRQRLDRFNRNSPSSDRSAPGLTSRGRSVFALNDFSILEDDLLGAPSYESWAPDSIIIRPEIFLSPPHCLAGYSKRIRTIAMLSSGGFYVAPADSDTCYSHNAKGDVSRRYPDFKNAKKGLVDRVLSVAVAKDGEKFSTLHADGAVVVREVSQLEVGESRDVTLIPEDSNGPPSSIGVTPESELVFVGDTAGHIRVFDIAGKKQNSFQKHGTLTKRSAVHFIEVSHYYNAAGRRATDSPTEQHSNFLSNAASSGSSGRSGGKDKDQHLRIIPPYLMMTGGGDNFVHLWLATTPEPNYCTYTKHEFPVKSGFFMPNGCTAITCDDKAIHMWGYTVLEVIGGKPPVVPSSPVDTTTPLRKVTLTELCRGLASSIMATSGSGNEGRVVLPPQQRGPANDGPSPPRYNPLIGPNTCWTARRTLFGPTGVSQVQIFTTSAAYRPPKGNCGLFVADTHGGMHIFTVYPNDSWAVSSTIRGAPACAMGTSPGMLIVGDVFGNLMQYRIRSSPQQIYCDF